MIRDPEMLEQLLDTIRNFVKNELVPLEHEVEESNAIPEHIVSQMKALGLFGLTIPEEYGGLGITMEEEILVALELGQTSAAFRSMAQTRKSRNICRVMPAGNISGPSV
jgi:acyl-CoA dehydrogenase